MRLDYDLVEGRDIGSLSPYGEVIVDRNMTLTVEGCDLERNWNSTLVPRFHLSQSAQANATSTKTKTKAKSDDEVVNLEEQLGHAQPNMSRADHTMKSIASNDLSAFAGVGNYGKTAVAAEEPAFNLLVQGSFTNYVMGEIDSMLREKYPGESAGETS